MTKMLDPTRLRAEADAHRTRMESPLWAADVERDDTWAAKGDVTPAPAPNLGSLNPVDPEILSRLDALTLSVEALAADRPTGVPPWLAQAAGNPLTYDAPDPARTSVCVRILPTSYARLQQAQARLGLRTTAGTWEYVVRLGLAACERLPGPH